MPKQNPDHPNIDVLLEQVRREAMRKVCGAPIERAAWFQQPPKTDAQLPNSFR
jgi:hypothetical protein